MATSPAAQVTVAPGRGADGPAPRPRRRRPRRDRRLWCGVATILAGGGVLRTLHLGARLPAVTYPDEGPIVELALGALAGDLAPSDVGWPPASIHLTAGAVWAGRALGLPLRPGSAQLFLFARGLFVAVSLAAVVLAGLLGARLADRRATRRPVAWGAALAVAVGYLGVRLGRQVHPDHLQAVLCAASFACTLRFDRSRRRPWLAVAGALAGLAGAAKYLGVLVAVPAALAVVFPPSTTRVGREPGSRLRGLVVLAFGVAGGFVAGSPGLVVDPARYWEGVAFQARRQATGHLGYEPEGTGWGFHLTQSLPGTWGWVLTALALAGTLLVVVNGTRAQRLAASFVAPVLVVLGGLQARFPHYVVVLLPFLAPLGFVAATRVGRALSRRGAAPAAAVVALSLVPTLGHDIRLLRAEVAPETRLLAAPMLASLPAPVWVEPYAVAGRPSPNMRLVASFGHTDAFGCGCIAVISSYMEERYRRRPDLYGTEVANYDALRRRGRVLAVFRPGRALDYRWDLLPQWGLGRLPLQGPTGAVGPTLTVLDLRPG